MMIKINKDDDDDDESFLGSKAKFNAVAKV